MAEEGALVPFLKKLPLNLSWLLLRLLWFALLAFYWVGAEVFTLVRESLAQGTKSSSAPQKLADKPSSDKGGEDGEFVLQQMRLAGNSRLESSECLLEDLEELRSTHRDVRISLQAEEEEQPRALLLGPGAAVRAACTALAALAPFEPEPPPESFFALHFTLREACEMPDNDELADAALDSDWVDLGATEEQEATAESAAPAAERSPRQLLRDRLKEALPPGGAVQLLTDRNPLATWGQDDVRVDLVGPLEPAAWEEATRAVLACEALGVYLSKQYDALFWCPGGELQRLLENQVESGLSHWKGTELRLGAGIGLGATAFPGFEDLVANVKAVLRGDQPPGWHRLEWTPGGEGSVPHMTY